MDRDTRLAAIRWLEQRTPAIVVEIATTRGSAPRGAGTRMLVSAVQAIGTIGGGHLEFKALATAREMLATQQPAPRHARYPLGPALGQCCGGVVELDFVPLDGAAIARWPEAPPLMHLQMHGAGHVGQAVATLLATLHVRCDWIDERDDPFPPTTTLGTPWPGHVQRRTADGAEAEVATAPPGAFFLVLTHDHALDFRIVEAALRRGDAGFVGLIGSTSKRERFRHRLALRGLDEACIARLQCPVGLPGVAGKQPEVIALAVAAQLMQHAAAVDRPTLSPASLPPRTTA
jgi:xanthine dehydrogenase accessory factor